jgi:hypothetical protein
VLRTALLFVRRAVRLVYAELPKPVAVCSPPPTGTHEPVALEQLTIGVSGVPLLLDVGHPAILDDDP